MLPACRSATSRYSEPDRAATCDQVEATLVDFRAPPGYGPVALPPEITSSAPRLAPRRQGEEPATLGVRCPSAYRGARYHMAGLPRPAGARPDVSTSSTSRTMRSRPKKRTLAFPRAHPGLFHPGNAHGLSPTGLSSSQGSRRRFRGRFLPCRFGSGLRRSIGFEGLIPLGSGDSPPKKRADLPSWR